MIGYFPDFYPDELVYSVLARYHAENGCLGYVSTAEDLFESPWVLPDIDFVNRYTDGAFERMTENQTMQEIILHHTMFPFYGRFLEYDRRNRAFQSLVNMAGNYRNLLAVQKSRTRETKKLKCCPQCIEEDYKQYGQTFWHRIHQIPQVHICPVHGCYLYESTVVNNSRKSPSLECASDYVKNTGTEYCEDALIRDVARYTAEVMETDVDFENLTSTGDFLHSRITDTQYTSNRGLQRNITLLFHDFSEKMKSVPWNTIDEVWKLSKIFTNSRMRTLEICLVAYFLDVTVSELTEMKLPEEKAEDLFDRKVVELRRKGLSYPEISRCLNTSINVVKPIGEGLYGAYNKGHGINQGGTKEMDWNKRDREALPKVRKAVKELYDTPRKVSRTTIQKMLYLPSRCFEKMPLCRAEIDRYSETQEEWWARKTVWAVNQIIQNGGTLNYSAVAKITNMKKEDFELCICHLYQYADVELANQITELLQRREA